MGEKSKKILLAGLSLFFLRAQTSFADVKSQALLIHEKGKYSFASGDYKKAIDLFEESRKLDPEIKENLHWIGLTYIKLEKFDQAEGALSQLLAENPDYAKAYFDYGFTLFRRGKYQEALPWFEKQLDQKENPLPLFYAGLSHYYLGQETEAIDLLKKVVSSFPSSETAASAKDWVEKIETKTVGEGRKAGKRWDLNASSGFFYDSNVIHDPEDENLTGFANQKDYAVITNLNFRYFLLTKDKTKLSAQYSGYQSAYLNRKFDSDNFNYGRHRGTLTTTRRLTDSIQLRFPVDYSFTMLGKAKYFQTAEGETAVDVVYMKNFLMTIAGGAKKDWYFGTFSNRNQNRSAIRPSAKIEQSFFVPNHRDLYFKVGYNYERNYAEGEDWDYYAHIIYTAFQIPMPWKTKFLLLTETTARRRFYHVDSVFGAKRFDKAGTFTGVFSKDILPYLSVSLSYTYVLQSSNLTRFTYHRHVAGLTLGTKW